MHYSSPRKACGFIELKNANVRWFLSIDREDLPEDTMRLGHPTFRSITVDRKEIEFSGGFTDLHTVVYQNTLKGEGFSLEDARPSVALAHDIRDAKPIGVNERAHPLAKRLKLAVE